MDFICFDVQVLPPKAEEGEEEQRPDPRLQRGELYSQSFWFALWSNRANMTMPSRTTPHHDNSANLLRWLTRMYNFLFSWDDTIT